MSQVITPTPGRIVWFYPAPHDGIATLNGQPLAAVVAGVHDDRLVNLAVFDAYGNTQQRSNVQLVQPDTTKPDGGSYATWMPYQISAAGIAQPEAQSTADMFAETDGSSASEAGLVNTTSTDGDTGGENDAAADTNVVDAEVKL